MWSGGLLAAAMLTTVMLAAPARADEPVRVFDRDPNAMPPPGTRFRLAAVGLGLTGGWYGLSLGAAFAWPSAPMADDLKIPIAGPWISLRWSGCTSQEGDCTPVLAAVRGVATVVDGIGQAAGLFFLLESLLLTEGTPVEPAKKPADFSWRPIPLTLPQGAGLGVVGTF